MMAPLRWGICATGLIAQDFATALLTNPTDHSIVAVGGRDPKKAKDFAEKFNVEHHFGSVEELATCDKVDIVYVASLTHLHYQHAKHYLQAGKHVLCEKPMTLSSQQTKELLKLAEDRKLFLMVGLWSRFFPAYKRLRESVDAGELGRIRVLQANFCVPKTNAVSRLNTLNMGGGALADFGVYLVHLACWVFGSKRPERILAVGDLFPSGADRSGTMTLKYDDGAVAVLTFSMDCGMETEAMVLGEKGKAKLGDIFWCPTKLTINDAISEDAIPGPDRHFNFWNSGGLVFEANHVKECIDKGLAESPILPHSDCQLMHDILDEGYRQLGVDYSDLCK